MQSAIWDAIFTDISAALTQLAMQVNTIPTFANALSANGSFNIWQRGAGAAANFAVPASTTQYTADRWYITTGANQASTVAAATSIDGSVVPAHAAKIQRNNGQTGITAMGSGYPLTADEMANLNGHQISFSGMAKAGANWSPTNGTLNINFYSGTGTAGKRGGGFVGETNVLSISVNIAPGVTNTQIGGTSVGLVPPGSTQGELQISWTPTGTAGADDSITLDAFCLVIGIVVQGFEDLPFDECLRQCKRFYRKSFPYGTAPAQNAGLAGSVAVMSAAAQLGFYVQTEPIELYATAAVTTFNPGGASGAWLGNGVSVTATLDTAAVGPKGFGIFSAVTVAANNAYYIHYVVDAGL